MTAHTVNATQDCLKAMKRNILQCPGQSPDLKLTQQLLKAEKTHKQTANEGSCSEALAKHLQGGKSEFGDVHRLQTTGSF